MNYVIREYNRDDLDKLKLIDKECFGINEMENSYLETVPFLDNNKIFVATIDEHIDGFISLMLVNTFRYRGMWVDLIGVNKYYRDNGIGKGLIEKAITFSKENNIEFVSALVRTDNVSSNIAFSQKGFISEEKTYNLFIL
jgi:ribosomal protein S18 acetylase RimI-like enzyme